MQPIDSHGRAVRGGRFFTCLGAFVLSFVSSAPTAGAQSAAPAEAFGETVEVRLVEIEVAVEDRKGRPVEPLSADSFVLEINGEPRSLDAFTAPTVGRPAAPTPEEPVANRVDLPQATPQPLYLAVYVDRNFMEDGDFDETRRLLPKFLDEVLSPGDQVLLATSGSELRVVMPFQSDLSKLNEELADLGGNGTGGKLASDARLLTQEMRRMTQIDAQRRTRQEVYLPILDRIEMFYRESLGGMLAASDHLARLVDTMIGLPGRRQILYVGGPVPSAEAKRLFEVWRDTFERSVDGNDLLTPTPEVRRIRRTATQAMSRNKDFAAASQVYGQLAGSAAGSGITFHTLGLENLRRSANFMASRADVAIGSHGLLANSPDVTADSRATLEIDDGLRTLSGRTGGLHFLGRRHIDKFLGRVGDDLRGRYVLGFYAQPAAEPYRVEVKLKDRRLNRKLNLRYRRQADVSSSVQELAQRTLSALITEQALANPLRADVVVQRVDQREGEAYLTLMVKVPMEGLAFLDQGDQQKGMLWIYATGAQLGKKPAPVVRTPVALNIPTSKLDIARGQRLEYELKIALPAGANRLAVSVRDDYGPTESTLAMHLPPLAENP